MYDIDKDLNEIRSMDASPSSELISNTKKNIMREEDEVFSRRKKAKRMHVARFSKILAIPAAAAAMFIIFINLAMPTPVSYYSVDINPNINMAVDENGIVCDVKSSELELSRKVSKDEIIGNPVEYAISRIIVEAQKEGYIGDSENILIGAFGDDEHNNISKNQILSYLENSLRETIVLLSVHGSIDDWKIANKSDVSAGLYSLSNLSGDIKITQDTTLDELILSIQNSQNKDIEEFLEANKEPIIYKAPVLTYKLSGKYVVLNWDYIDFKKYNYDGNITYQLISAQTTDELLSNPTIVDEFTFASWDIQPTEYTLLRNEENKDTYYSIVANYDDGKRIIDGNYVIVKGSN